MVGVGHPGDSVESSAGLHVSGILGIIGTLAWQVAAVSLTLLQPLEQWFLPRSYRLNRRLGVSPDKIESGVHGHNGQVRTPVYVPWVYKH